ncbi:MAG: hypothetical protein JSV22_05400 [Bacteroidales bacterium]|nr:MAG: hypothetical protein JSV22_05400 [Bacteroidales bacterium]
MKSIFTILLFISVLIFCKKDFRILECTMQEWIGGRQKSGKGVNYKITMVTETTSDKLELKELWIRERLCKHKLYNLNTGEFGNSFNKNDTLILTGTLTIYDLKNNIDSTREVPFDFSEQIVIGYILRNKTKYKPYKDIKALKPLLLK